MNEIIYKCDYKNYCVYCNTSCEEKNPLYNCSQCYICNGLRKYEDRQILKNATEKLKSQKIKLSAIHKKELIVETPNYINFLNECFISKIIFFPVELFLWCNNTHKFYFSRRLLYEFYIDKSKDYTPASVFNKEMMKNKLINDGGRKKIKGVQHPTCFIEHLLYNTICVNDEKLGSVTLSSLIPDNFRSIKLINDK